MTSIAAMIARLEGLLGTADLTEWEQGFVRKIVVNTAAQRATGKPLDLSPAQLEKVDELHGKHFAG